MINTQQLSESGLDQTEAKIYLAMLELGPSTVSEITKKAQVTRTLGYHIIQKLSWYGLVDKTSGAGTRARFAAQHPRRLVQFAEQKKSAWERKIKATEALLPDLISIYKEAEKPTVRYQDGPEGIKSIFNETLESKTEILVISEMEGWSSKVFESWGKDYVRERIKRRIKARILFLDTPFARKWLRNYKNNKHTEYRWIKPEKLKGIADFGGEMNIWENKMAMGIHEPSSMGITIESTSLATILKSMFELAWEQAETNKK